MSERKQNVIELELEPVLNKEAYDMAYKQLAELKMVAYSVEATIERIKANLSNIATDTTEFGGPNAGIMTICGAEIQIEFHIDDAISMKLGANMKPVKLHHGHITKIDASIMDVFPIFGIEDEYRRSHLKPGHDNVVKFTVRSVGNYMRLTDCCFIDAYVLRNLATAEHPNGWFSGDVLFAFADQCVTWKV
jgi:Cu/Ag efflux protein CusF